MTNIICQFKPGDQLELINPQAFGSGSWISKHQNKLIVDKVISSLSGEQCVTFQGHPGMGYYAHRFRHKFLFIND